MAIILKDNSFCGFVSVGDRKYTFEINVGNTLSENKYTFQLDWRLKTLLGSSLNKFLEENDFNDPKQFHAMFSDFVKVQLGSKIKSESWLQNPLQMCSVIKNLKDEVENLRQYIKNLDLENGTVGVQVTDSQMRNHEAIVKLSANYPRDPLHLIKYDLPIQTQEYSQANSDLSASCSVGEFCKKFILLINTFQEFWNTVALVDSQCWVLDPPSPTFKDISRRIKLTDTLSAVLTFNPFMPAQRPSIKLLGSQSSVSQYNEILQKNLEEELWDPEEDLLYNLSNILEISLPSKITSEENRDMFESNDAGECAICFTWRLNDEIPNEVCEKVTCKSIYHTICLFTYLSSVPRNRDYFGKIQGECPNCDELISCSVPKFN